MSDPKKPYNLALPLDYFKGPSRVHLWKGRLGWGVFGLTVGGLLLHWLFSKEPHLGASPGPVSSVHQVWDNTCSACHDPFTVTSTHSWAPPGMEHSTSESCQTCHKGSPHHTNQTPYLNCASCHREHNGRDFSLVKIADAHCTQCHQDLQAHSTAERLLQFRNVTVFAEGKHPPFPSIQSDPGKIHFNHALHMMPGMPLRDEHGVGGTTFRLKDIPEKYRKRYADQQSDKSPNAPVDLDCRSCHQMETADFNLSPEQQREIGPAALAARSPGKAFLPITYENQCKACHPLQVEDGMPGGAVKALTVPHRKQPAELDRWLEDYFTAQAVRGMVGFEKMKAPRPLPGEKSVKETLEPGLKKLVDVHLERSARSLYKEPLKKNCRLCHTVDETKEVKKTKDGEEIVWHWSIPPSNIPEIWMKYARFDHMAHRAVDCRACHENAYPTLADGAVNPKASAHHKDVLVPNIENCATCHAPASTKRVDGERQKVGGVRFDCVLCHTYHNGAQPLSGRGAKARGARHPRSIPEVLKGTRH